VCFRRFGLHFHRGFERCHGFDRPAESVEHDAS
jgi:hypothetical protein